MAEAPTTVGNTNYGFQAGEPEGASTPEFGFEDFEDVEGGSISRQDAFNFFNPHGIYSARETSYLGVAAGIGTAGLVYGGYRYIKRSLYSQESKTPELAEELEPPSDENTQQFWLAAMVILSAGLLIFLYKKKE
jgi:hypothetical protein